jgi:DNA-binding Lrp family transcriptional regulator
VYEDLVQNLKNHPLVLRLAEANHGRDGGGEPGRREPQVVSAYILIQAEVGKAARVAKDVAGIKGVGLAEAVAGPYDVIARADVSSLDMLARLVVRQIQDVEGVTRTLTCPVVRL